MLRSLVWKAARSHTVGLEFWLCHVLVEWLWADDFSSLRFSFLICKMATILASEGNCGD